MPPITSDEWAHRWDVLVAHRDELLRLARSRTLSWDDAEDCVQEALTRAVQFEGLDLERAGAFLATTTIRLTTDLHRARQRQARLALRVEGLGAATHDFADDIADSALARWLHQQTAELSEQEQAVLSARVDGGSSRDAAEALGISLRAAESSLTRARTKLQSAWAKVAVVVGALWMTARRHAALSVPLTTVAAVVALGPVVLLPSVTPAPPEAAPAVVAPQLTAPRVTAPQVTRRTARPTAAPTATAVRRTSVAAPVAPARPRRHWHHGRCGQECDGPDLTDTAATVKVGSTEVVVAATDGLQVDVALAPHLPDLSLRVAFFK